MSRVYASLNETDVEEYEKDPEKGMLQFVLTIWWWVVYSLGRYHFINAPRVGLYTEWYGSQEHIGGTPVSRTAQDLRELLLQEWNVNSECTVPTTSNHERKTREYTLLLIFFCQLWKLLLALLVSTNNKLSLVKTVNCFFRINHKKKNKVLWFHIKCYLAKKILKGFLRFTNISL